MTVALWQHQPHSQEFALGRRHSKQDGFDVERQPEHIRHRRFTSSSGVCRSVASWPNDEHQSTQLKYMRWNKNQSNQATFYTGEAGSSSRADAMTELWEIVANEVLPQNEGVDWDYVRTEFWTDSGRIIVFPAASGIEQRIEKVGCQMIFSELLSAYDQLAAADRSEYHAIPVNGRSAQDALIEFTKDQANFRKTLEMLAKSVSQSAGVPLE